MKLLNFNSGWGMMMVSNVRVRQMERLGVKNVPARVLTHNNGQENAQRAYEARYKYGMPANFGLTIA